jgi:hypothetical protein
MASPRALVIFKDDWVELQAHEAICSIESHDAMRSLAPLVKARGIGMTRR